MSYIGEVDAIAFNQDLEDTYKRYLFTSNMLSDSDPDLRSAFLSKLGSDYEIVRGPYVHATPCYKPAQTVRELALGKGDSSLSQGMLDLPRDAFDPDRPLYSHQVEAMKVLGEGRNLVVATGTGSGKTESYLLPILDSILKDPSPGLRAIIIYPLNALANDQLFRLRELLKEIPKVTFGRYTGETQETIQEKLGLPNERESRSEIRESPPHILLTNFAMLEYLLLRPRDSELFKNNSLKFIVLDEAHTYNGAQGIEISMLMRRLKHHLEDAENKIQFILTSATIGDGVDAKPEVAKFASDLTGNHFEVSDVLSGETINSFHDQMEENPPLSKLLDSIGTADFVRWQAALGTPTLLEGMLKEIGFPVGQSNEERAPSKILYDAFYRYSPLAKIHDRCRHLPAKISELCSVVGLESTDQACRVIRWLVTLAAYARKAHDYAPLLPTRLHFFCRGLAGATVCVNDACDAKGPHSHTQWSDFFLEDRNSCPSCEANVLPILSCVHCGLPVAKIYVENGKWKKSFDPTSQQKARLLTWSRDAQEDLDENEENVQVQHMTLCLSCNQIVEGTALGDCCDKNIHRTLQVIPTDNDTGDLPKCTSCGGASGSYPTVLREFTTSEDAPTAVLAETIIRNLPSDKRRKDVPANGRKLLVFSDSRQRAAFFAPYLLQTTAETAFKGPLEAAIQRAEDDRGKPISFKRVAMEYEDGLEGMGTIVFKEKENGVEYYKIVPESLAYEDAREEARKEAERELYRNFCSSQKQRTTLTGMGIASLVINYTSQGKKQIVEQLPEVFAGNEERAWEVLQALIEIMVQRVAVDFPNHVKANPHIFTLGPHTYTFHLSDSGRRDQSTRQLYRWNSYLGPERGRKRSVNGSRQLEILCKAFALDRFKDEERLKPLLTKIWDAFKDAVLKEMPACPGEYRVDRECLAITTHAPLYSCDTCGKVTALGRLGFCTKVGCTGKTVPLSAADMDRKFGNNHYRHRYFLPALPLEVREHTAQITNEWGKKYQELFNEGKVNVLSSSTTFEMGIDVGDLKAVMLRNVPPSPSSYIQRAGRAGRRQDGVSIALTYARNVPHDQYNFHDPRLVIAGKVLVPYINTSNVPLAQRHCNSLLLGGFLRSLGAVDDVNLDKLSVDDFFIRQIGGKTLAITMQEWAESKENAGHLLQALSMVIPADSKLSPESALSVSTTTLCVGEKSVLEYHVQQELKQFDTKIEELNQEAINAIREGNQSGAKIAGKASIMQKLRSQFLDQRLIDFLSSCSWLPGYAFPQDIVKLKVLDPEYARRMRLERDREVGISEYAPGAEIIADGKLFKSAGVEYKGQSDQRWWIHCRECRRIETGRFTDTPPPACTNCGLSFLGASAPRNYIRPDGFTTRLDEPPMMPRLSRLRPPRTSEVFLLEGTDFFVESKDVKGVTYGIKQGGKLFRANSGRKFKSFLLCPTCGQYFESRPTNRGHVKPWGAPCSGVPKPLDLAHEIVTDILQIRFQGCTPPPPKLNEDKPFWRSLFSAVINGACDSLGIAAGDIDGTYHGWSMESYIGELVIYDKVPGGAGHIDRIIQNFDKVLMFAYNRVKNCSCKDIDSSCYACLRSYSNQFYWDELQRRPVIEWLSKILNIGN